MPTAAAAAVRLRALADFIECEGITPTRFAASGDCEDVVLVLRVRSGGQELIELLNSHDGKPKQRRLPLDPDPQLPLIP